MRKFVKVAMAGLASLMLVSGVALAHVPGIPYQGRLTDAAGAVINGAQDIQVSLYNGTTNALLYRENHTAVTVTNGLFSIEIGTGTPVTGTFAGVNFGAFDLTLGIKVGADAEMTPLVHLGFAPFAKASQRSADAVGIASVKQGSSVNFNASASVALATASITTPGPGFILVIAGGQIFAPASFSADMWISETAGGSTDFGNYGIVSNPTASGMFLQYERQRVYQKNAAGTFTFRLNGGPGNASGYLWQGTVTLLFIPTSMGTVTLAPPAGMEPVRQPAQPQ